MARLNVNPTRQELSKVKKNLESAGRGHRLLKDKRDELVRRGRESKREMTALQGEVNPKLSAVLENFAVALGEMGEKETRTVILNEKKPPEMRVEKRSVMGCSVPSFSADFGECGLIEKSANRRLYLAAKGLYEIAEPLLRLAELEAKAEAFLKESERCSRRVNALEHVMIPNYLETVRYIKLRLDENERANSIRLLKVKDMVIEGKKR